MPRHEPDIELYLAEIAKYKLLNAEEEHALAKRIAKGDNPARDEMTRRNLRLVVAIARKYLDRGLSFMDLIEEGNLGLIKAVERFSTDQGCKFSTYASWWIKQSIRRALINKVRNVRVPAYMIELMTRYRREASRMSQELKRDVAPDEVAQAMGLKPGKLQPLMQALNANTLSAGIGDDDEIDSLAELPEKERQDNPESLIERYGAHTLYDAMYHHLDPREQQILWMRYGLDGQETSNWTLEQIGEAVGLTRERVRQIEARALVKLRSLINQRTGDNDNDTSESSASRMAIKQSLQGKLTETMVKNLQEKRQSGKANKARSSSKAASVPASNAPAAAATPPARTPPNAAPASTQPVPLHTPTAVPHPKAVSGRHKVASISGRQPAVDSEPRNAKRAAQDSAAAAQDENAPPATGT